MGNLRDMGYTINYKQGLVESEDWLVFLESPINSRLFEIHWIST